MHLLYRNSASNALISGLSRLRSSPYHRLQNLKLEDKEIFQGEEVTFLAYYDYCVFGRIETNQSGS